MERIFQIAAIILIGVAAFFLWNGYTDGLFVAAVAGAVCFFLSIRFQVGDRLKQRQSEKSDEENTEASEDLKSVG
jgi:hypothetical protein